MTKYQDPDPLVRGMDPWIWIPILTKMSWIRNTAKYIQNKYMRESVQSSEKTSWVAVLSVFVFSGGLSAVSNENYTAGWSTSIKS